MVKVLAPATAVTVGAPPQLLTTFGVAAITRFVVSASLKVSAVLAGEPAGLVRVKVRVEVPPASIGVGPNALFNDGCSSVDNWSATALVRTPPTVTMSA